MMVWLVDTAIYSGLLIVLVLALRRPVARWLGPQMAYALWALPFLRLMMPPIVLPASLAPLHSAGAGLVHAGTLAQAGEFGGGVGVWLLAVWLGGAAALLAGRALCYFPMRHDLLIEARAVGQAGAIRLVESPSVSTPIAFGVHDKIVALPPGFMAQADIAARDMAIAHELAHHRGHDLLANIAAQLLLALHWFNPLAWLGWRAMRRDQEAACDARVMHGLGRHDRAAYAQVIAGFAAGPRLMLGSPLAAPMACPLLGEKSILHRLRTLSRDEVSPARRYFGRAAMALALMALPATASISYASIEQSAPVPRLTPKAREIALTQMLEPVPTPALVAVTPARIPASTRGQQVAAITPRQPAPPEMKQAPEPPASNSAPTAVQNPAGSQLAIAPRLIRVRWEITVQHFEQQTGPRTLQQRMTRYSFLVACPPDTSVAAVDVPRPTVAAIAPAAMAPAVVEQAVSNSAAGLDCSRPQEV